MAKTVAVLLADGFESIEALATVDILRRGEVAVTLVSIKETPVVLSAQNIAVTADAVLADVDLSAYDMLVLPGGSLGVQNIGECKAATDEVVRRMQANQPVAAICAAPMILGDCGLLAGRKAVCYPTCEEGWPQGVYQAGEDVVVDGNLITSAGPGTAIPFGLQILATLEGQKAADQVAADMLVK